MKFAYAKSFIDDFDNKLLYYKDFDKANLTSLETKLYSRVEEIKTSLSIFPQIGKPVGRVRVLSLGKNKKDVFRKLELYYTTQKDSIIFLNLFHTSQDI